MAEAAIFRRNAEAPSRAGNDILAKALHFD
jgi:hypothetical protein